MIDIGINLASEQFADDWEAVIERAQAHGIQFMMITGSCPLSNEKSLEIAQKYPNFARSTAGIHPHHADKTTQAHLDQIESLLKEPLVCAVGETGLDFFRDISCRKNQQKIFEAHIEIAIQTEKPLFLHQRDSHETFFPIIKEARDALQNAVVHCFTDSKKALYDYLDLDLYIGMTGWVCDERRGQHLWPLIKDIPTNRLMIETDGPYLLPRTIRPKPKRHRNEPMYLPYVAQQIADLTNKPVEMVIEETTKTAQDFFQITEIQS